MKLLAIGLFSMTMAFNAFAVETKICLITTDINSEQTDLMVETNSNGELDSIRLYKMMDSKVVSDESLSADRAIEEGMVASEREGHDVVILRPKNFSAINGGVIALDYLYNGISGARKEINLKMTKVAGKFVLTTIEGVQVNRLLVIGNRLMGKVIGIKEIRISFK